MASSHDKFPKETAIEHPALKIIKDEHSSLSAMLRSMRMMIDRGPKDQPEKFFDVLRAMLFYIDEFPEKQHHPKESKLFFPMVARAHPQIKETIDRLEHDHEHGEKSVRELMHHLLAWELLGESRRQAFQTACARYIDFYLEHMRLEETIVLPAAQTALSAEDWAKVDAAFSANRDPLDRSNASEPQYARLFTRIVMHAPAPIGLGHE
jgi:hemerythrin-like domain-containing protein